MKTTDVRGIIVTVRKVKPGSYELYEGTTCVGYCIERHDDWYAEVIVSDQYENACGESMRDCLDSLRFMSKSRRAFLSTEKGQQQNREYTDRLRQRLEIQNTAPHIERWYDRSTRTWVVQKLDPQGNQIGTAFYVQRKSEAKSITLADFGDA